MSLVSCHTLFQKKKILPDNLSEYKRGSFYGIVNLHQKNQSYRFKSDVFISEDGRWRMDLSVSPGLPVFTLLYRSGQDRSGQEWASPSLRPPRSSSQKPQKTNQININTKELIILFLRQKEFYKGSVTEALPPPLSKMPGWDILKEIFFERPVKKDGWTCKTNEKNQIETCRSPLWTVQWERKKKRSFSIENKDFTFTFQYLSFSPKLDEKVLTLPLPKNFKPVSLGK